MPLQAPDFQLNILKKRSLVCFCVFLLSFYFQFLCDNFVWLKKSKEKKI